MLRMLSLLLLVGCGRVAELRTYDCADCIECELDDDCVIAHNPCQEVAVCGHIDEPLAVTSEGCSAALEYNTPDPSLCVCEQSRCTAAPEP